MNESAYKVAVPMWWPVLALVLLLFLYPPSLFASEAHVDRFTLPNGLKVLVKEDHLRKVTAIQLWVMVGGSDETDTERGISHLIEHMAFKGTEKRGVGQIAAELEALGGYVNAFTARDETVFHVTVPSAATIQGLDVLMDAVLNPTIDPDELEKEKKVVLEEILEREERPEVKLYEFLNDHAYLKHPYRYPIIGYVKTVKGFTRDDILAFRKKWYVAENMFLVVVGDVNAAELRPAIERLAGPLPARNLFRPPKPVEPPQKKIRSAILRDKNAREARLSIAFHIPSMRHSDVNALDLTSSILGGRQSSRLVRVIKKEKALVNEISTYALTPKYPGLFNVSATLDPKNMEAVIRAVMEEIQNLAKKPPSSEELQRAKTDIESDHVYANETVDGVAQNMGSFQSVLGYAEYEDKYLMLNAAVTKEQISEVVRKYLKPPNITLAVLLPDGKRDDLKAEKLGAIIQSFAPTKIAKATDEAKDEVVTRTLANGMRVVLIPDRSNPVLSFRIASFGGKRFETKHTEGIFNYISRMMTKGTDKFSELEILRKIEDMGGKISGFSGYDSFGVGASLFSRHVNEGLALLADIYTNVSFPEDKLERERKLIINRIETEPDRATAFAIKNLNEVLYLRHPYGFDKNGTPPTVKAFKRDDLIQTYRKYSVPENAVLTGVGDMDVNKTMERIVELFGKIERKAMNQPNIPKEEPIEKVREQTVEIPRAKTHIVIGFQGCTLKDEDRYALAVLNNLMSNQGGRLFQELRDKKSLAYVVTSFFRARLDPGVFGFYIATDPAKTDEAVKGLLEEIRKVRETPVKNEELKRAISNLIGNHLISLQSSWSRAENTVLNVLYGLGYDYDKKYVSKLSAVTADQVLKVAQKYLSPDKYVLVKIIPERKKS